MHKPQEQVRQFHRAMGVASPEEPTLFAYPYELRVDLLEEELDEFAEACANRDMVGMIDALGDIIYVAYGAAEAMGIDLEAFFDEIHRSNMAKLWEDGKPRRRDDGKILKSPDWTPPDIKGLLKRIYGVER